MMGKALTINFNDTGLKALARKSPEAFTKAMQRAALQFLTWCNVGSPQETRTPPIRYGILRGSSSAFVGGKLVGIHPQSIKEGADEQISPARSHNAPPDTFTVVWNTDYATKMHEWSGNWGKYTKQAPDAGNKWIEKHVVADKEALVKMIGIEVQKELRT